MTDGPYWNLKNQGMVATVVKAAAAGTVTVRCGIIACHDKSNNLISVTLSLHISGGTRTGGVWEGKRGKLAH